MSEDKDVRVWKLEETEDWVPWKRQMTFILKGKGLYKFLGDNQTTEGKSPQELAKEEQDKMKASATIMGNLSFKVFTQWWANGTCKAWAEIHIRNYLNFGVS
ncbi:hypothetical protein V1509DRAFT_216220 [Lipomyces kononenkoae]